MSLYAAASSLRGNSQAAGRSGQDDAVKQRAERSADVAAEAVARDRGQLMRGFGSVGGEEMLSYLMISDTLAEEGGDRVEGVGAARSSGSARRDAERRRLLERSPLHHQHDLRHGRRGDDARVGRRLRPEPDRPKRKLKSRPAVPSAPMSSAATPDGGRGVAAWTRRELLGTSVAAALTWCVAACRDTQPDDPPRGDTPGRDPSGDDWRAPAEASLARGAAWLWTQQRQNGAFPSSTYGLLRDGQSLTPFSLLALLQVHPDVLEFPIDRAQRALFKMIQMTTPEGALGFFSNAASDYPSYSTAMMLTCLGILKPREWAEAAGLPVRWLRSQQFRAASGWEGHPAQGGWGFGSATPRTPPAAGHVDLSMTRAVLEGLRSVGIPRDDPALVEARDFVARCQAADGSFFYSPVELGLNKAGVDASGNPRGYGTATTDGLLALLALGADGSRDAVDAARSWLHEHHRVDRNPGLDGGPMEVFADAMRGYYRAGAAECFLLTGGPPGWRAELSRAVAAEQREDGSWHNPNPLQKEDDPIVATGFAVRALAATLRVAPEQTG